MKYKQDITFKDESTKAKLVEKYKQRIIERVQSLIGDDFDFDLKLSVVIRDVEPVINYVNKEVNNGFASWNKKDGSFIIVLNSDSLEQIEYDNGLDLDISIVHELAHVYDIYHIMHNKYYEINFLFQRQKTMPNFIIREGWNFWTEYYAYYTTFNNFYDLVDYPTVHQLAVAYEELYKQYEIIKPLLDDKKNQDNELIEKHINELKQFTYALAKYCAGAIAGKPRYYKVMLTKKNEKYVKELDKIIRKALKQIIKLCKNTYGKGMHRKLWNLGNILIDEIYAKFNIFPIKYKGYITYCYYVED